MRKFLTSKKGFALLATMIVAVAASVSAYAYFTTNGAGDGTATVGTSSALVITGTTSAQFYPGGPAVSVSLSAKNNSPGNQYINTVTFTGADAYASAADRTAGTPNINGTGAAQCDVTQFSGSAALAEGQNLTGGGAVTPLTNNASVSLADSGTSQDGCKNAFLALHFTSN